MEKSRKKIRICLVCVVLMAVIIGITYYLYDMRSVEQISQGTLIARVGNRAGLLWR